MKYILIICGFFLSHFPGVSCGADLVGSWQTDCVVFGRHSYRALATFTSDKLIVINYLFENQSCQSHSVTSTYTGNYSIGANTPTGFEIIQEPTSLKFTLHLQSVVDHYNQNNLDGCGIDDWQLDKERDVSGKYCRPYQLPKIGELVLDIFGTSGGNLQFGRSPTLVGGGPAHQQPTTLSDPIYKKVF